MQENGRKELKVGGKEGRNERDKLERTTGKEKKIVNDGRQERRKER